MYPVLIDWGFLFVPAWHFFYVLGALAAFQLLLYLAKKHEPTLTNDFLTKIFITCYISGYMGSRLMSIFIEEYSAFEAVKSMKDKCIIFFERLFSFGPMTFYGGAILAFLCAGIYALVSKKSLLSTFDIGVPAGFLALAIGRIGCLLNGDDYGKEVTPGPDGSFPFWAINIPALGEDVYRWPVQLIESLSVFVLVFLMVISFKKTRETFNKGSVAFITTMGYANIRLFTEFLRDDFRGSVIFSWLSTSQFISIIILIAGGIWGLYQRLPPKN